MAAVDALSRGLIPPDLARVIAATRIGGHHLTDPGAKDGPAFARIRTDARLADRHAGRLRFLCDPGGHGGDGQGRASGRAVTPARSGRLALGSRAPQLGTDTTRRRKNYSSLPGNYLRGSR